MAAAEKPPAQAQSLPAPGKQNLVNYLLLQLIMALIGL